MSTESLKHDLVSSQAEKVWRAAELAGEMVLENPEEAWTLCLAGGSSTNEESRTATAACVLEHILEHHFVTYFRRLKSGIEQGDDLLADTFLRCWKFGQAELTDNAMQWDALAFACEKKLKAISAAGHDAQLTNKGNT